MTAEPSTDTTPRWSHDGRWAYFASDRGDRQSRIWKAPFEVGAAVQVTKGVASMPMESPDGKGIHFYNREGHVASMPLEGGPEEGISIAVSYYAPHFFEGPGIDAGAVFFGASSGSGKTLEIR